MEYKEAYKLALEKLKNDDFEILITDVIEKEYGWLFCYNSKLYVENGNLWFSLVGNLPVLINKITKEPYFIGGGSIEEGLDCYEREVLGWKIKWKLIVEDGIDKETKSNLITFLKNKLKFTSSESLNFLSGELIFDTLSDALEVKSFIVGNVVLHRLFDS